MDVAGKLKEKRGELAERMRALEAEMTQVRGQMDALTKVIGIYEPDWQPEDASARPRRRRSGKSEEAKELDRVIGGTNKRQATLEILWEAERPMSTAECAVAFAERHGVPADDPRIGTISNQLSAVLDGLQRAGRVRYAGTVDGRRRQWEIAA